MIRVVGAWLAFPFLAALILHLAHRGWIGPKALLIEQRDDALHAVRKKDQALYLVEQEVKRRQARIDDLCRKLERAESQLRVTPADERWLAEQFPEGEK